MLLILQALSRLFVANSAATISAASTTENSSEDDALNLPPRLQALVSSRYPSIPRHLDLASVPHSPPKKYTFKTIPQKLLRSQSSVQIPLESSLIADDDSEKHKQGTAASSTSHGNRHCSHRHSQHQLSLRFQTLNHPSYNDVRCDNEEDDADFFTDSIDEHNAITAIESPVYYSSSESEASPRVSLDAGSGTTVSFEGPSSTSRFGTFHSFCASHTRSTQTNGFPTKSVPSYKPVTRSTSFSQQHSYHDVTADSKYERRQEHSTKSYDDGLSAAMERPDDEADNEVQVSNSAPSTFPTDKSLAAEPFIANALLCKHETEESLLVKTPVDKFLTKHLPSDESHAAERPMPEDSSKRSSISVNSESFSANFDEEKRHEQHTQKYINSAASDNDASMNQPSFDAASTKDYVPSDVLFSMMNTSDLGSQNVDVPMKKDSCEAVEVDPQKEQDPQPLQSSTDSDGAQHQNEQVISSHRPDERLEQPFDKECIAKALCEKRTPDALYLNFNPDNDEETQSDHGNTEEVDVPDMLDKHPQHSSDKENQSQSSSKSETQVDRDQSHAPDKNEKTKNENNDTINTVLDTPKGDLGDDDDSMILERISAVCALATTYRAAQVVLYACGSTAHLWLRTPPPPPVTIYVVDDESGKSSQTAASQLQNTISFLPNNVDVKYVRTSLDSENWDIDLIEEGFDWHLPSVWIADIDIAQGCLGSYEEIDSFLRIVYSLTNPQSTVILSYPGKISVLRARAKKDHGNEGEQQRVQSATDFSPRSFERFVSRRSFRVLYDKKIEGDNYLDVHVAALVQKSSASNAVSPPHSDISDPSSAAKDDDSHRKQNENMSEYGSDTVEGPSTKSGSFGATNSDLVSESKDDVNSTSTNVSMTTGRHAEQEETSEKLTEESHVEEEEPDVDKQDLNTRTVEFRLRVESIPGDLAHRASGAIVIGNETILGFWTASGAQLMEGNVHDRTSTLTKSVVLENVADIGLLEYKYALVHSGHIVAWEAGYNRLIHEASHLPTDRVHILDESWRN